KLRPSKLVTVLGIPATGTFNGFWTVTAGFWSAGSSYSFLTRKGLVTGAGLRFVTIGELLGETTRWPTAPTCAVISGAQKAAAKQTQITLPRAGRLDRMGYLLEDAKSNGRPSGCASQYKTELRRIRRFYDHSFFSERVSIFGCGGRL